MTRRRRAAITAVVTVCAAAGGAGALAAFLSTTSNSGNSAATATSFARLKMATGSYTGTGLDNRAIGSLTFQPDVVIVKGAGTQIAVIRTSSMTGDAAKPAAGATALTANLIQSLTATGFTVGTDARVNSLNVQYRWVAFDATPGMLDVGSYPGNGTSQSLSGLGFSPEWAVVMAANANRPVHRIEGMSRSYRFEADTGATNRITSLDADGASVGNSAEVNSNGIVYHYIAVNERGAVMRADSYTGTGAARDLTGVGFQPEWVIVRADDPVTARGARHRMAATPTASSHFFAGAADGAGAITALQPDGFQLGTNGDVNANGVNYEFVAFRQR